MKLSVSVDMEIKDGRSYLSINFPKNQPEITAQETSHILAGAISLLIKSSSQGDKIHHETNRSRHNRASHGK
jgi:hypothetical protein